MSKEKKVKVEVTFSIEAIVRKDMSIEDLLTKETDFIAEPTSANGCVLSMRIKKIHT